MQAQEKFSILLVDDDSMVIRILSRILGGFTPLRFATSGHAALKLAHESPPDLMFLDVDMPELSGFEVCKAFKKNPVLAEVPIIFITSHESVQLEAKGLELGASDFITKPPHASLVLARVRTYQRLKSLSDTMRDAITMDFLTGAVTRRQLEKKLTQEWLRAERSSAPLALLLADIEGFTEYNLEFGEEKGDVCLKSVADCLGLAAQRPTDVVGRYTGGQFMVLLPDTDAHRANVVAQRAVDALRDLHIPQTVQGISSRVRLSVGGGCRTPSRSPVRGAAAAAVPNDLIAAAGRALKGARLTGHYQARIIDGIESGDAKSASTAR
jgi:diguanylate cyclase (GGDEF)-like protein